MGKRGPPPTPNAILKLRGSWREKHRNGPDVQVRDSDCPKWLGPRVARHWDEISEILMGLGIMADVHRTSLACLCQAIADWMETTEETNRKKKLTTRMMDQRDRRRQAVMKACRELGMTPSAISGLKTVKAEDKSGLGAFKLAT